jgi:6-phospho-beta-glucosidase
VRNETVSHDATQPVARSTATRRVGVRIAIVGGGSTYTPELINGMAALGCTGLDEITLIDPDRRRLDRVGPFCRRLLRNSGSSTTVRWTADLDEGLDGTCIVILQLRVGGQDARHCDESWPQEYGCLGQETTGAGGLAKAMRTVPVVLDIAERVRLRTDPSAWIVDFTNPVGIITRALLDAGHRAIGLCNCAIHFQRYVAAQLGVDPFAVELDHVGLNHLTWVLQVRVGGVDRLPELLRTRCVSIADHIGISVDALRLTGAIPSYYLRYFYGHDEVVGAQRGRPTRAQVVTRLEEQLLAAYGDPELDHIPPLLAERGGSYYSDAAVALLESLCGNRNERQVVNVRNSDTLDFLPSQAVVEVPAMVDMSGAHPLPSPRIGPLLRGLISQVSAYEELALEAALLGGRDRVVAALLAHPLVGQLATATALADRLIRENARYLRWVRPSGAQ